MGSAFAAMSRRSLKESAGFTLVELITVLVVLGILSIGTVRFITDSSAGFATTISRTELAGDARFAVERMSRTLRDALPNSVRSNGACVEHIPVLAASGYTTLPVAIAASSFTAAPFDPLPTLPAETRAAVYPTAAAYSLAAVGELSPPVALSGPNVDNEITITLSGAHRFVAESPTKRVFLVSDPVSYCVDGGALYRYSNYGFNPAQPGVGALPSGLPDRVLMAQEVAVPAPFSTSGATLTRNAVVLMDLAFERNGDRVRLAHQVQVRNVP